MQWLHAIQRWTDYLVTAGYTFNTIEQRRYQLRRLAEANLRRSPWRVKTSDLVAWMAVQEWSLESRRSYRAAFVTFYTWAVKAGHTKHNPAAGLPHVQTPRTVPRPTPDTVTVVAFAAASDRDRLILYLAAYAGLRRAEIAGLHWTDITPNGLRIKGKGNRQRIVPVHRVLAAELAEEWHRRQRGEFGTGYRYRTCFCGCLFPGQSGKPMTPNAIGRAASAALGGGWGAHSLRHSFATKAYRGSRDLLAVQALLGHSKPETTKRYTELATESLAQVVANV